MAVTYQQVADVLAAAIGGEKADEILRAVGQSLRVERALDARFESGRADELDAFARECREALGEVPEVVACSLAAFDSATLALLRLVLRGSSGHQEFLDRFRVFQRACEARHVEGARRVLASLLERRFGRDLPPWIGSALRAAGVHQLNYCFERLAAGQALDDVLAPLLEPRA